jgi:hypothetical protein
MKRRNDAQEQAAAEELKRRLSDPMWRIENLYKIIVKGSDDDSGLVTQFKPNRAQRRFISRLHHRNIILKARQLGFTTLIAIIWLDHALFNSNSRCGIIAHDREAAEVIFRDKVKFAYDNLPAELRAAMPLARDSATELLFAHNNSSVRVATSMRSGTIHRLHISEFGKICARYPEKAKEVITGSIPAVPLNGITIIESTAEGAEGEFHDMTQRARAIEDQGRPLTERDYRFHFFPWWGDESYRMATDNVLLTPKDHEYFDRIEVAEQCKLDDQQRAWYVATRDTDFAGSAERMWQEYPSTPKEAFQVSTEGCYYTDQLTQARKKGRVLSIPDLSVPVNTFWDIGNSDGCAIWLHQQVGMEDRFIGYIEAHGETLKHYVHELQATGHVWNKHFLPHDAAHKRLSDTNKSTEQMLRDLGLQNIVIVPQITDINTGIQITREAFGSAYFDESGCKQGLQRLENYKKKWNATDGRWANEPKHDSNSEGADAFRQWAQAKSAGLITKSGHNSSLRSHAEVEYSVFT